jgi:hypothetical protein
VDLTAGSGQKIFGERWTRKGLIKRLFINTYHNASLLHKIAGS